MSEIEKIDTTKVPEHIAIIMDGNGRWAKQRGLDRSEGHRQGVDTVKNILKAASKINVKYLTLYTFSTENWNRPQEEVDALMGLMIHAVARETEELVENGVALKVIGDIQRLPKKTLKALNECMDATKMGKSTTLILALSYSSKWELTTATQRIAMDVKNNILSADDISETTISSYLETKAFPDPDMLIRTGGEHRISNFLLWQIAYSELYFTDELWPDFGEDAFFRAIIDFQGRERRFGKTSEQLVL